MSEIKISYYGHSCFQIMYEGHSVVLDPYEDGSVPGLKLPHDIHADAVYCSHDHKDHDAEELIQTTGINPFPFFKTPVPHDDAGGRLRGFCDITFLKVGSAVIVHMGDLGRIPTEEEYEALQKADVVMMPVGGYYTVDAEKAAEILQKVNAKLNILMHYRKGHRGYDVLAEIGAVKQSFPYLLTLNDTSISFAEDAVPQKTITLEPIQ